MEGEGLKSRMDYIVHKGQRILHIDHTAMEELPEGAAVRAFFARARQEIDSQPPRSVRLLTSVSSRMRFNAEIAAAERRFAQENTPYILKSAVVGATPTIKAIIATLRFFAGRDICSFETAEEALDWLAE